MGVNCIMIIENMIKYCENLTPTDNQIAQYILENKAKIESYSMQQLADNTFTSKSAIHRFCKKIGLDGYNDLKVKLVKDIVNEKISDNQIDVNFPFNSTDSQKMIAQSIMDLYEAAITDTYNFIDIKELNKVVALLHNAEIIDIYTHAHNINVAENFQDKMRSIGRMVNCARSFYEQRCMATASKKNHVAMILSYSGRATFLPSITEVLHKKGIPVILIGRAGNNVMKSFIKHRLYLSDKENLRNRISQFSSHIAMQFMLDILFACIFKMNYKKNIDYIQEVISIVDDRKLSEEK